MFTSILSPTYPWSERVNRINRGLLLLVILELLATNVAAQSDRDVQLLEPNKPVERELTGGQSHTYRMILTAGQYVRVTVDQRGIDVVVTLLVLTANRLSKLTLQMATRGRRRSLQ